MLVIDVIACKHNKRVAVIKLLETDVTVLIHMFLCSFKGGKII